MRRNFRDNASKIKSVMIPDSQQLSTFHAQQQQQNKKEPTSKAKSSRVLTNRAMTLE